MTMLGVFLILTSAGAVAEPLVFETDSFRLVLSPEATSVAFVDKATGTDYCDVGKALPFATWVDDTARPATAARLDDGLLVIQFGDGEREAMFRVTAKKRRLEFALVSLMGATEALQELHFASIPLTLAGTMDASFAVSPLALNLETYCAEIPGHTPTISGAKCFAKLGMEGAAIAIVACPSGELRDALKDAVTDADAIPKSANGGPWALDSEINQQSYFLDVSGKVNEQTVDSWITMIKGLGVKQLDLHGGYAFRFGDYVPNPKEYPNGRDSLKAVVDRLHEAGIAVGLHTYAMFIAKDAPWVTPVPDPGLAKNAVFTLASDLSEADAVVPVAETTEKMSPLTGFHHRNSATIQIDEELIVFSGVSKEPTYAFTECQRGAYGTTPAPHAKEAKVYHLKECFGLFAPDPDSELFDKVIAETAKTYNDCGFDMMYMDALDGSDVIDLKGGGQFAWYYGAKFTYELVRQLNNAPLMEMSTFGHHLWAVRSRMGAWDACQRAPQTFADIHVLSNREWKKHFLPTNLGWWGVFSWNGVQPKRSLPVDVEYICGKALGTNSSLSLLLGFSPQTYPESYNQQRLGSIINRYETLRLSGVVPQALRDQLATPGKAFHLEDGPDGAYQFRPVDFARHDIASADGNDSWQVENPRKTQTPRITIETLLSANAYDSPDSTLIEDFANPAAYTAVQCNEGVAATFSVVDTPVKDAPVSASIVATNTSAERHRAWVTMERAFDPPIDLNGRGLGLWVYGDGKGAILNLQIRNPKHVTFALTEHYVKLDFTGWRYVELIDTEDYAIERYEWPYSRPRSEWQDNLASAMGFAYPVYHAHLNYGQIGELHIALNDLPQGEEVQVFMGPIRSIPQKSAAFSNPGLTFNGQRIAFPVSLESGHLLEFTPPNAYTVCDKAGELLTTGTTEGDAPVLQPGANTVEFTCDPPDDAALHARVTLTTAGEALER
jgi:hypothetical protein